MTPLLVYGQCDLAGFALDDNKLRPALAAACSGSGPFAEGAVCHVELTGNSAAFCGTESMVRDYVCQQRQWLWAANARFCPQWSRCQWQGVNLTCVGNNSNAGDLWLPTNLDRRLRHVRVENYPSLYRVPNVWGQTLPVLESLIVRNTVL